MLNIYLTSGHILSAKKVFIVSVTPFEAPSIVATILREASIWASFVDLA